MSRTIGGLEVAFTKANPTFNNYDNRFPNEDGTGFDPSTTTLPAGWQRKPGFRPLPIDLVWHRDVAIPLRDGVVLRGDVFLPATQADRPLPAILPWSPYGKTGSGRQQTINFTYLGVRPCDLSGLEKFEAPDPAEWCPRGYAVVNVDARGCYDSEGDIFVYGTQEGRDGADAVDWIGEQKWCNGNVALVGNSWLATTQWFIAAERPKHLKAIAPWEGLGDYYRESICRGGIPNHAFWDFLMADFNGRNEREDVGTMVEKHPHCNAYWEDKRPMLQNIDIPMYVLASYSTGLHTEGTIRGFQYTSSKEKWLRIHPTQEWHDIYQEDTNDDLQRFLDHYLIGANNGWEHTPKYRLSLLRYNAPPVRFRVEDNYPPSRTQYRTLHLNAASKSLSTDPPPPDTPTSTLSYQSDSSSDPGAHFTYTFPTRTSLIGFSKVTLTMSCSDHDDLDVYVVLRKLDRTGTPLLNINIPPKDWPAGTTPDDIPNENIYKYVGPNGRLRASKRTTAQEPGLTAEMRRLRSPAEVWYPMDEEKKVKPGEMVEMEIGIWPGGIVFEQGEGLRLEVKGRDPTLPEFLALEGHIRNGNRGRHVVHTGAGVKSELLVPLIEE